jgi:hypothetical protein
MLWPERDARTNFCRVTVCSVVRKEERIFKLGSPNGRMGIYAADSEGMYLMGYYEVPKSNSCTFKGKHFPSRYAYN